MPLSCASKNGYNGILSILFVYGIMFNTIKFSFHALGFSNYKNLGNLRKNGRREVKLTTVNTVSFQFSHFPHSWLQVH